MRTASLAFLLALTAAACGQPRNYNQCILKNVRPGLSNDAVRAVKQACEGEFPLERPAESEAAPLTDPEAVIGDGELIFDDE